MKKETADQIVRSKAMQFLDGIVRDLRSRDEIRHAAASLFDEIRLAGLEREHFGDIEKGTGIYAPRQESAHG